MIWMSFLAKQTGTKEESGEKMASNREVNKEKNFVSCVVYLHNEGSPVKGFLKEICGIMRENFDKYEVICVNDGCVDDTVEQVKEFLGEE